MRNTLQCRMKGRAERLLIIGDPSMPKKTTKKLKLKRKSPRQGNGITPAQFKKALPGTCGNVKLIAERLQVSWGCIYNKLKRLREGHKKYQTKAWQSAWQAYKDEQEYMADIAEETIGDVMRQRLDLSSAARTAKWYLERKHGEDRGYKEKRELTLEGGSTPIHVKNEEVLPLDSLDLPLDVRKQILEAMEKKESADADK